MIKPVGLAVGAGGSEGQVLYVGSLRGKVHGAASSGGQSADARRNGEVVMLRLPSGSHVRTLRHELLVHPAGMLEHDGTLYVLEQVHSALAHALATCRPLAGHVSQVHRALLSFNVSTGQFERVLLRGLPDLPEAIEISTAC